VLLDKTRSSMIRSCLHCSDTDLPCFRTRHSALNPRVDYQYPAFVNTCNRVLVDPVRMLNMCIEDKLFSYDRSLFSWESDSWKIEVHIQSHTKFGILKEDITNMHS